MDISSWFLPCLPNEILSLLTVTSVFTDGLVLRMSFQDIGMAFLILESSEIQFSLFFNLRLILFSEI